MFELFENTAVSCMKSCIPVKIYSVVNDLIINIFRSRHLDAVGSRCSFYIGASNSNIYGTSFGFNSRGFVSKHDYNSRIYSPVKSHPITFGRQYSTHAATEKKSKKMLLYLTGLVFAMVGCSYAAVPLYRRFCQATGYGGTVQRREVSLAGFSFVDPVFIYVFHLVD